MSKIVSGQSYWKIKIKDKASQLYWAQLFKTNDVIRQYIFKTLIIKYGIYTNIFAEKICKSYSHFFSKNNCELDIVLTRKLTFWPLTSSLSKQCFEQLGPDC